MLDSNWALMDQLLLGKKLKINLLCSPVALKGGMVKQPFPYLTFKEGVSVVRS